MKTKLVLLLLLVLAACAFVPDDGGSARHILPTATVRAPRQVVTALPRPPVITMAPGPAPAATEARPRPEDMQKSYCQAIGCPVPRPPARRTRTP